MASPISTPPTPEEEDDDGNLPVSVGPDHYRYSFPSDHHSLLTENVFAQSWSAFSLDYNHTSHHENSSCLQQLLQWLALKCSCCEAAPFPKLSQPRRIPFCRRTKSVHPQRKCFNNFSAQRQGFAPFGIFFRPNLLSILNSADLILPCCGYHQLHVTRGFLTRAKKVETVEVDGLSQRAVTTALWCNFLVFSLKFGVWLSTSSHVMLAEVVHSAADFTNQALLAYGLSSSRRAPDALHPYGYSKERFVWSLISAVGIFCLGSGATIIHGIQNLWTSQPPEHVEYAALVLAGSFIIEGASLVVAIHAVRKGAAAEGMKVRDYIWRGHDPTAVAVMAEDGAAVTGLVIAAASLVAVNATGNAIYDPIGSIIVGNLLGMVAIFLIQRNRHALIGRAIDNHDMERVLHFLRNDPVVDSVYDCKSEVIGPGFFRFKAEIDFNGVVLVQNYLSRTGREEWAKQFREAAKQGDDSALLKIMSNYGEEVVTALGSEVDRLEKEIQEIVPGIRHVDIEAHNPISPSP